MDDVRAGRAVRMTRIGRGWRQLDLAEAAGVSRATVSRIEGGHLSTFSVSTLRRVCGRLELTATVDLRGRGGDLDRMLSVRHSRLHESVLSTLTRECPEWSFHPEVSFNVWGERGVIDLILWHSAAKAMLIVELKTELTDVNAMLGTMDRRRRLAPTIAADRGWQPETISAWIIVAASRTNQRRIAEHRTLIASAYPANRIAIRAWLKRPAGTIAGLSTWTVDHSNGARIAPIRRVHRGPHSRVAARDTRREAGTVRA